MFTWFLRRVIFPLAGAIVRRRLTAFERATSLPQETQEALLRRILVQHANTDFANHHHFHHMQGLADFRRHVPIATYERLEPYIQRVAQGEYRALLADARVHMFAMTSGTTATRKLIPVTHQYLKDYRRGWNLWGLKVYRDHPEVKFRPIVQMSGDWQETTSPTGIPCGAVTGLTATTQMRIVRWLYTVPACVGKVKEPLAKYYLVLRLSLIERPGMVITANPSTLVNLARLGDQEKETLIRDIHDGTLSDRFDIPADVRSALSYVLRQGHPTRTTELEEIVRRTGTLYPKDYWPKDCLIGTWTGGSVGAYLRHFPTYFGNTPVRDVGLIASEGRMTIPLADNTPSGVLDITSHFFEFIPEEEGDSSKPTVLCAHELQEGKNYYILLTTAYGLYRYNIHDVVRCTGFFNKTPLLEFLSKGSHFANITGEKISEYHVTGAMTAVLKEMNLNLSAYSLAPCWDDVQPYYGLFIERGDLTNIDQGIDMAQRLERHLSELNIEYAGKRDSRRLGPVRLELIATGAWHKWDRARLAHTGGSPDQYKHPCLISDPKFRETIGVEEERMARL
jgi:GH3 auxin-responsive promoter